MAGVPGSSGLPWVAEIDALLRVLRALGVHAGVDENVSTVRLASRSRRHGLRSSMLPLSPARNRYLTRVRSD
jgi:hypothetical protein